MTRARIPGRVRLLRALRAAGDRGVHTLSIRSELKIGNPAERRADLERRGFLITSKVEIRGGHHGSRYRLVRDLGDSAAWKTDAELDTEGAAGSGSSPPLASGALSGGSDVGGGTSQKAPPPAVDVSTERWAWIRDWDGKWKFELYDFEGWGPPEQLRIGEAA